MYTSGKPVRAYGTLLKASFNKSIRARAGSRAQPERKDVRGATHLKNIEVLAGHAKTTKCFSVILRLMKLMH